MRLGSAAVGGLTVWNYAINRRIPPRRYVVANLTATTAVIALGRMRVDRDRLGLQLHRGWRTGLAGAAAVAAGSLAASRLPFTSHLFTDQRVSADDVAYQALIRIPLGTVLLEEVAFRAVLPALLNGADRANPSASSAALFGLWHIIPTLNALNINEVHDPARRVKAVVAGVATTFVAGWALDKLRLRAGSVVAPMLVHWSANAVSYAIAAARQP